MTSEELDIHIEALAQNKLEEPKRMSKQCEIYWSEISAHQYLFDRGARTILFNKLIIEAYIGYST
jgi:hypothetical protein